MKFGIHKLLQTSTKNTFVIHPVTLEKPDGLYCIFLSQEKANLEKLESDCQQVQGDVERNRQQLERQRSDKQVLEREKRALEETVGVLEKEKDALQGNCLDLETHLGHLKR